MWSLTEFTDKLKINSKIGLFVSGGFDSTTLAYLICDTIYEQKLTTELVIITVPRSDDSWRHSENVINWLEQEFNIKLDHLSLGDPTLHHSKQVSSGIQDMRKINPDMLLLLADTQNPSEEIHGTAPVRIKSMNPLIYQPWFNLNKTEIIKIAQNLDILDTVSRLSHTCTESIELRCNFCWQCQERAWAFSKLNLLDVGKK
jgi:NH3-dependent NAD+ synthetase